MSVWIKKENQNQVNGWWKDYKYKPFVIQKPVIHKPKVVVVKTDRERYAAHKLDKYMKKYGLIQAGWRYQFDTAKTRAGQCRYRSKVISISKYYVNQKETVTRKDIKNTILHEVAHALTPTHGHDKVWKAKAIEIGCDGKRCCDQITKTGEFKYNFVCEEGSCTFGRHRYSKAMMERKRMCVKHRKPIKLVSSR